MDRMNRFLLIAVLALGLTGCGSPRPVNYYQAQLPPAPAASAGTYPIDIVVSRLAGPSLLQSSPIVYRTGSNQIGTYAYHRWADPPVVLVQARLIGLLRNSGDYRAVGEMGAIGKPDFIVRGRLSELSEVDAGTIGALVT